MTSAIAALIAHIAIDVLGDYLLPHDTYDDVAHGSRSIICCSALVVLGVAALRLLLGTLDEIRRPGRAKRPWIPSGVFAKSVSFVLVVGTAFVLLASMEAVDLAFAGQRIDDLGDLLGGSIALGMTVTLPVALAIAECAWRLTHWCLDARFAALRIFIIWLDKRLRRSNVPCIRANRVRPRSSFGPAFVRSASKRGPPSLLR